MTSDLRKCGYCTKRFPDDEVLHCANCSRIACTDCVDEHEKDDERECECEHLCQECRDGPDECKGCMTKGCPLCMGAGCDRCTETKKHVHDLVCDDCRETCGVCKKDYCKEHIYRCSNADDSDDEDRMHKICTGCMKKLLVPSSEQSRKRSRSTSPTAAELAPPESK